MRLRIAVLTAVVCAGLSLAGLAPADDNVPPPPPAGEQIEARGQVHEAFAEATQTVGTTGALAAKQPPDPIEETPPEEKPEGEHVVWIPGYWSYDDEAKDFVWISGLWRALPPGRTWIPGTWQQGEDGWQRVSGYWSVEGQADEPEYLPPPPESLDNGPTTAAPDDSSTYVPGCWLFQSDRYRWRPGFWVPFQANWVWTPDCYKWTPAGYLFVSGYWDAPLCNRGLLFAPVRFTRPLYLRRGFVYTPSYVVQPDFLIGSLFVRANTRHYYFGDYFEPRYRRTFIPWFDYRVHKNVRDGNFSYYRAAYARHPAWERNLQTLYKQRYAGDVPRPPRTLLQQRKAINNLTVNRTGNTIVHKNANITHLQNVSALQPIRRMKSLQVTGLGRLAHIPPAELKKAPIHRQMVLQTARKEQLVQEKRHAERLRTVAHERQMSERKLTVQTPIHKRIAPVKARVTLPKHVAPPRVVRQPVKPPTRPVAPQVDPRQVHQPGKTFTPPRRTSVPVAPPKKPVPPVKR